MPPEQQKKETGRRESAVDGWLPESDADRAAVLAQVERVLGHALFNKRKRFQSVLRYTVDRVLAGRGDELKEQTLGEHVFGRAPDYDTAVDHIVRSTVSEMRKRLAQYYAMPEHASEVWITIPPGSYAPSFRKCAPSPPAIATGMAPTSRRVRPYLLGLGLVAICAVAIVWLGMRPRTAVDRFWEPALSSQGEALVCAGTLTLPESNRNSPEASPGEEIRFAAGLSSVTTLLRGKGRTSRIVPATSVTLADLSAGPSVLIGAFNNPWTLRFTGPLRFHFVFEPSTHSAFIEDRENPSGRDWRVRFGVPKSEPNRDYGIVARFKEPTTQRMTVVLAGQLKFGVGAAIALVTTPGFMESLDRQAPGWDRKNLELVFSDDRVDGKTSSPQIVAAQVW